MNTQTRRKPENHETNAARQARLRERRKELGYRRVSLWLSPEQVDSLERQGGEPWLGSKVKQLLDNTVSAPVSDNAPAQWREADRLNKAGLSWAEIFSAIAENPICKARQTE